MLDKFALLGVPQGFDEPEGIDEKFRELSRKTHPDRVPPKERARAAAQMTALNDAYKTLKDPVRRAEHLLALRGVSGDVKMTPGFLEQTLEDREKLLEAKMDGGPAAVERLAQGVRGKRQQAMDEIAKVLREERVADNDLQRTAELLARLRYYARYLDEVEGRAAEM